MKSQQVALRFSLSKGLKLSPKTFFLKMNFPSHEIHATHVLH